MDFEIFWQEMSREDLWREVSRHWQDSSRARVLLLLAMRHTETLSLSEIETETGLHANWLAADLKLLQKQGVVARVNGETPMFCIADVEEFIIFLRKYFHRVEVEAGYLETLARWAQHDIKAE